MSQWSAYYFSRLKKKKKLRESLLLMNSIKEKLQRKRFSAKIIQHGAELKTARWPKVEGPSWFQNPDLEFRRLSFLAYLIPRVSLFFFHLISPLFFPPPFLSPTSLPTPEVAGETPSWDLQKSFFNFPFDKRVKTFERAAPSKANCEGGRPACCGPSSGS